jgi:hypothetical protein
MGLSKEGVNQEKYFHQKQGSRVTEGSRPKGVKPKMKQRKLKEGFIWQGA